MADRDEGGHVERVAHAASAAADLRAPFHLQDSRVIGASPARLAASFGSIVPSSGISTIMAIAVTAPMTGMERRIAWRRASAGILGNEARELGVDLLELAVHLPQTGAKLGQNDLVARSFQTVPAGGAILVQGEARDVQLADFMHGFAANRLGVEFEHRPHPRQHGGIDAIGLGALADGLREAAGACRD